MAERAILAAGAATSAIAVAQIVIPPITPREIAPDDGCDTVAALEARLDRSARNEAIGTGALAHGRNVLVDAALGTATSLAGGRWRLAAVTFAARGRATSGPVDDRRHGRTAGRRPHDRRHLQTRSPSRPVAGRAPDWQCTRTGDPAQV